jgi:hypothetical protein
MGDGFWGYLVVLLGVVLLFLGVQSFLFSQAAAVPGQVVPATGAEILRIIGSVLVIVSGLLWIKRFDKYTSSFLTPSKRKSLFYLLLIVGLFLSLLQAPMISYG